VRVSFFPRMFVRWFQVFSDMWRQWERRHIAEQTQKASSRGVFGPCLNGPSAFRAAPLALGLDQDLENLAFAGRQLGNGSVAPVCACFGNLSPSQIGSKIAYTWPM
jgi:hypothetical protein